MNDSRSKDSRDRSKPGTPEGAVPTNDQRRFRSEHKPGEDTGDEARRTVDDGDTSGDAPMDPSDKDFIESK